MKKLTLVSGGLPHARQKKHGLVRGLTAFALVSAMFLMLYLLGHWALTDSDPILRGLAALAVVICTMATAVFIAIGR
jgi:hypothetical protein